MRQGATPSDARLQGSQHDSTSNGNQIIGAMIRQSTKTAVTSENGFGAGSHTCEWGAGRSVGGVVMMSILFGGAPGVSCPPYWRIVR